MNLLTLRWFPLCILIALILAACSATQPASAPAAAPTATPVAAEPTATPDVSTTTPMTASEAITEEAAAGTVADAASSLIFALDPANSEARFSIYEELAGSPKTVVGVTKRVSGTITLNPADLSQTTISPIQIDASDLTTDDGMRNQAIRRWVLQSSQEAYRYITFEPTAIEGLPAQAQPGDAFTFTVAGNLKIRDITQPVLFTVEATADSATQISGLATATVTRTAYELTIPSVPRVANVSDEVGLELAFVAVAE
jgi:polyisoprenoid-binding protein YceI